MERKMKIQICRSSEQEQKPLRYHSAVYDIFNQLESYRNIMQFQIISRRRSSQNILVFIKIRVLRNASAKDFVSLDVKDVYVYVRCIRFRVSIADLSLLRTL